MGVIETLFQAEPNGLEDIIFLSNFDFTPLSRDLLKVRTSYYAKKIIRTHFRVSKTRPEPKIGPELGNFYCHKGAKFTNKTQDGSRTDGSLRDGF